MLKTPDIPIRKGILNHLQKMQDEINALPTYKQQVLHAKILWQTKKKSKAQKSAFQRVEKELQKIAVGTQSACNYCEINKGTNIEHIYPKNLYPKKTFDWKNYLWTCQQCNGKHKISQFQVFETPNSAKVINLKVNYKFQEPPNTDSVFINPRTENPLDFLKLDLESGVFYIVEQDKSSRAYKRAAYTLEVLQLNKRKGLVQNRKEYYRIYIQKLQHYIQVYHAQKKLELEFSPIYNKYKELLLEKLKTKICLFLQKDIISSPHPTIWKEMQRQASSINELETLFVQYPPALFW